MKTKIKPKIFRDAMDVVTKTTTGCCYALNFASPNWRVAYIARKFLGKRLGIPGLIGLGYKWMFDQNGYTSRIIALELCALMLEDEQKKIKKKRHVQKRL